MDKEYKNVDEDLFSDGDALFYSRAIINKIFHDGLLDFQAKLTLDLIDAGAQAELDFIIKGIERDGKLPNLDLFGTRFKDWELADYYLDNTSLGELVEELRNARQIAELRRTSVLWKNMDDAGSSADTLVTFLHGALNRLDTFEDFTADNYVDDTYSDTLARRDKDNQRYASSGFDEIDKDVGGFSLTDGDMVLVTARTNSGKSWFLLKSALESAKRGLRVGFVSPEMPRMLVQYRLDALNFGTNLSEILRGVTSEDDLNLYKQQRDALSKRDLFLKIATKKSFGGSITFNKIQSFCMRFDIQVLYIDGLSYLDIPTSRYKSEAERLTDLAEDLHTLMSNRQMVIVFAIQSNRDGFKDSPDRMPSLLNVRGSDGPGQVSTLAFSIVRDRNTKLFCISLEKSRNGEAFNKYNYEVDLNVGKFIYKGGGDARLGGNVIREEFTKKVQKRGADFKQIDDVIIDEEGW